MTCICFILTSNGSNSMIKQQVPLLFLKLETSQFICQQSNDNHIVNDTIYILSKQNNNVKEVQTKNSNFQTQGNLKNELFKNYDHVKCGKNIENDLWWKGRKRNQKRDVRTEDKGAHIMQ